jgi:hypothetical protein
LLERYGLAGWQRLIANVRTSPDYQTALVQAYGKPMSSLETEWQDYLPEYFGGSYNINHFARYDLGIARGHVQGGRYVEARDELQGVVKFLTNAGRTAKEGELRDFAKQIDLGLEGDNLVLQGQAQMAAFQYADAHATFGQARQRYEAIGGAAKVLEADQLIQTATSGVTALTQLEDAKRLLADLKYAEARTAAVEASKAFAALGDEEHYRQSWLILQDLNTTQTRLAYLLATLGILLVLWAFWRLRSHAQRRSIPGVLQ